MLTKTFALPVLPPSINRLHIVDHYRRKVYLNDESRKWKSDMQALIPRFEIPAESLLAIDYVAYYPWHHRNGRRRRVDCSNLMKLLHDTVCERIRIDDSRVVRGSFGAVDSPVESIVVTLTEIAQVIDSGHSGG